MHEMKKVVDNFGNILGYIDERPDGLHFAFKAHAFPDGSGLEFLSLEEAEEYLRG